MRFSSSVAESSSVLPTRLADAQVTPRVTGIVHTAETDIAYEQFGQDDGHTPSIIVNGGPGFSHTYMYLTDVFTRKFAHDRTVTFYDQRGVGNSRLVVASAPQGMPTQVADLEALRVKLRHDKIDLIGHSWGGQIAMAYAAAYPQHVQHLVLVDSAAPKFSQTLFLFDQVFPDQLAQDEQFAISTNSEPETGLQSELPSTVNRLILGRSQAGVMLRRYLARDFYSEERFQELIGDLSNEQIGEIINNDVSKAVVDAVASVDLTDSIKKLNVPTLVMWGRFDINVAVLTGWKISQAIPGAKMVIYSKSGHFPFYEEESPFLRDLNQFLSEPRGVAVSAVVSEQ
jgi:proline iminopeptidase